MSSIFRLKTEDSQEILPKKSRSSRKSKRGRPMPPSRPPSVLFRNLRNKTLKVRFGDNFRIAPKSVIRFFIALKLFGQVNETEYLAAFEFAEMQTRSSLSHHSKLMLDVLGLPDNVLPIDLELLLREFKILPTRRQYEGFRNQPGFSFQVIAVNTLQIGSEPRRIAVGYRDKGTYRPLHSRADTNWVEISRGLPVDNAEFVDKAPILHSIMRGMGMP